MKSLWFNNYVLFRARSQANVLKNRLPICVAPNVPWALTACCFIHSLQSNLRRGYIGQDNMLVAAGKWIENVHCRERVNHLTSTAPLPLKESSHTSWTCAIQPSVLQCSWMAKTGLWSRELKSQGEGDTAPPHFFLRLVIRRVSGKKQQGSPCARALFKALGKC